MSNIKNIIPDNYTFILATAIGLAAGGILSLIFGRYALPTKTPFEFTLAGFRVGVILTNLLIIISVGAIVFFGYVSMVVRDTAFPHAHPWFFFLETIAVSFIPASMVYVIQDFREDGHIALSNLNKEFIFLAVKFSIFHLLFQLSGMYSYFFNRS